MIFLIIDIHFLNGILVLRSQQVIELELLWVSLVLRNTIISVIGNLGFQKTPGRARCYIVLRNEARSVFLLDHAECSRLDGARLLVEGEFWLVGCPFSSCGAWLSFVKDFVWKSSIDLDLWYAAHGSAISWEAFHGSVDLRHQCSTLIIPTVSRVNSQSLPLRPCIVDPIWVLDELSKLIDIWLDVVVCNRVDVQIKLGDNLLRHTSQLTCRNGLATLSRHRGPIGLYSHLFSTFLSTGLLQLLIVQHFYFYKVS